jgi:hypothetical protein
MELTRDEAIENATFLTGRDRPVEYLGILIPPTDEICFEIISYDNAGRHLAKTRTIFELFMRILWDTPRISKHEEIRRVYLKRTDLSDRDRSWIRHELAYREFDGAGCITTEEPLPEASPTPTQIGRYITFLDF